MRNQLALIFLAELLGTFGLVFFAAGSSIVDVLSGGLLTLVGVAFCSGLAVMAMIYTFSEISGAHINPAVTLGFVLSKHIKFKHAIVYFIGQISGAILASQLLKSLFGLTGGVGGHLPSGSAIQSLGIEVVLTFTLMSVILATVVNRNQLGHLGGLIIGATVVLCVLLGGPISGGSMNPARSFGPSMAGWMWSSHWVYWLGPFIGAGLAGIGYMNLIRRWMEIKGIASKNVVSPRIQKVLFACVHNSGRSQMAEAFAVQLWKDFGEFRSAGTEPADTIDPLVVVAMREKMIDLSQKYPKLLTEEMIMEADRVITMGCSIESICPAIEGVSEDWKLDDPAGKSLEEIRFIRDKIECNVRDVLFEKFNGTLNLGQHGKSFS